MTITLPVLTPVSTGYCAGGVTAHCGQFARWRIDGDMVCDRHAKQRLFNLARADRLRLLQLPRAAK